MLLHANQLGYLMFGLFVTFALLLCLQCPIVDLECLHMLINTVRVFCVWPKPYGTIARNIFKILLLEKRSPGGTMRARLHRERMQITHVCVFPVHFLPHAFPSHMHTDTLTPRHY